ncbi:hypothetical protein [Parapedobacter sp. 2B3]|uniref:hypothetical protein n=1 Tax=Parapedobacter sp. 2B3 TaxID=3342381 RepID=UPI0035B5AA32
MRVTCHRLLIKSKRQKYCMFLVISACVVLYPVLFNGFSQRSGDDDWMVYNNPFVQSLDWQNIIFCFSTFYNGQYSPINTVFYSIIAKIFGMDPFWFHLFSLVLHIVNTIMVFVLVQRILIARASVTNDNMRLDVENIGLVGMFTAFLFAIHPVQVESIAWISASKNLLYTFFSLYALSFYVTYRSSGRAFDYLIVILFYLLAFGSKEQAAILPASLILVDWYTGKFVWSYRYWMSVIPLFLLALIMGVVTLEAQNSGFSNRLINEYYPLWQRIVLSCYAFTEYIFKGLLPIKLNYIYSFPMKTGEPMPVIYWLYPPAIASLALLLGYAWKRGFRSLFFGLGFLTINLSLALHVVPMARNGLVADRYLYFGSVGLFFIVSYYAFIQKKIELFRLKLDFRVVIICYVLYLSIFSWLYALQWK